MDILVHAECGKCGKGTTAHVSLPEEGYGETTVGKSLIRVGKPQQGQSGATTGYIALAEKWEKEASGLDNEIVAAVGRVGESEKAPSVVACRDMLRHCARELRAI